MASNSWKAALLGGLFAGAALFAAGCGGPDTTSDDTDTAGVAAMTEGDIETNQAPAEPATEAVVEDNVVYIEMKTNRGSIILKLDEEKAPISVANFVGYAERGAYDGTIFHRVIRNFMIQGGGLEPDLDRRPFESAIKNEWQNGLSNTRGSIAMARIGNEPDSATNQFFINVKDNDHLDTPSDGAGYAVFGEVIEGMGVVDTIANVRTGVRGGLDDVPVDPVIIESVQVLDAAAASRYAGTSS